MTACNESIQNQRSIKSVKIAAKKATAEQKQRSTSNNNKQDSLQKERQVETGISKQKKKIEESVEILPATKYTELPGDVHFNGKPMTQQVELSKKRYETYPDTLSNLAIARYKTYDSFFPISIADNFEAGISTERIVYPKKLIFNFQLFEDDATSTPYITKQIIVTRHENGLMIAE